jgi:beta-lactamase class D
LKTIFYIMLFFCMSVVADESYSCDENCTFVLKSGKESTYQVTNKFRSNERFSPFSTFKIPNSLIALELGVVKSPIQKLTFDRSAYPVQQWWPKIWHQSSLNLRDAFQNSALPIYQQIASQVGDKNMKTFVSKFNFGNTDTSSGIDTFWANGSLKVTAREQVDFLQRLNDRRLPVSEKTISLLKEVMLVESTDKYNLYAKTGGGFVGDGLLLGWYVGFVENEDSTYYFALNFETENFSDLKKLRVDIARQKLMQAGVI